MAAPRARNVVTCNRRYFKTSEKLLCGGAFELRRRSGCDISGSANSVRTILSSASVNRSYQTRNTSGCQTLDCEWTKTHLEATARRLSDVPRRAMARCGIASAIVKSPRGIWE